MGDPIFYLANMPPLPRPHLDVETVTEAGSTPICLRFPGLLLNNTRDSWLTLINAPIAVIQFSPLL